MGKGKAKMEFLPYEHKVHYYETDQMGIAHHSNYIRWFEEARVDFMEQGGFSYKELESRGIISPVLEVNAKYKSMCYFGDRLCICTCLLYTSDAADE